MRVIQKQEWAEALAAARKSTGLTQLATATECEVPLKTWQKWEQADRQPTEREKKSIISQLEQIKKESK